MDEECNDLHALADDVLTVCNSLTDCPWFCDIRPILEAEAKRYGIDYEEIDYSDDVLFKTIVYRATGRRCDLFKFTQALNNVYGMVREEGRCYE